MRCPLPSFNAIHANARAFAALQAGGFVAEGRINGSLNLSRALGDMDYKQSKDLGPSAQVTCPSPS